MRLYRLNAMWFHRRQTTASWKVAGGLILLLVAGTSALPQAPSSAESDRPVLQPAASSILSPMAIAWTTGAGKWVGYWGRRELVLCPRGGKLEGAWGTDIYTDDSSICTAAVHAGLLSTREGGPATIEMRPDAGQYGGSLRNGVRTGDWMEPWTGAYVFVRGDPAREPAIAATSHMQADSWAGQAGRVLTFSCPPLIELHTIYGTDVYTDDSYVCTAAVHRGIITRKAGGLVTIQLLKDQTSFAAVARHGVTSLPQESWAGQSYRFVATPPNTPPPPTAETPFDHAPAVIEPPLDRGAPL
jgi:hypothetical protein